MSRNIIGALVVLALLIGLAMFGPAACNRYLTMQKTAKIQKGQNGALLDSLDVANSTAAELDKAEASTAAETKDQADEIRKAPAGNSNDVADRSVCNLRAYRNSERCASLRAADTSKPAGDHSVR